VVIAVYNKVALCNCCQAGWGQRHNHSASLSWCMWILMRLIHGAHWWLFMDYSLMNIYILVQQLMPAVSQCCKIDSIINVRWDGNAGMPCIQWHFHWPL